MEYYITSNFLDVKNTSVELTRFNAESWWITKDKNFAENLEPLANHAAGKENNLHMVCNNTSQTLFII